MNLPPPDLSIIIPAFNEERRLPESLERIQDYLAARALRAEVIVVDDGSTDATARVVTDTAERYPLVRLVSNGRNHGKGYSVRHGMMEARGDIALSLPMPTFPRRSRRRISYWRPCARAIGTAPSDRGRWTAA